MLGPKAPKGAKVLGPKVLGAKVLRPRVLGPKVLGRGAGTKGAGSKTHLESSIKKFKPMYVYLVACI